MGSILNYLWRAWFIFLAFFFMFLFGLPVILLSINPRHLRYCYFFIRLWCVVLFYLMGFNYKLINPKRLKLSPGQQYIFIANHTSIIDIMLICVLHPRHPICFIGKAELAKIPVFNIIYKRICILVDRKSPRSRAEVYRRADEKMRNGQNLVIFPEGGVPDDTSIILDEFKDGAFKMSAESRTPIASYTFVGLKKMFPFDNGKGRPGTVKVVFNNIYEPPENPEVLKLISHNEIKKTLIRYGI